MELMRQMQSVPAWFHLSVMGRERTLFNSNAVVATSPCPDSTSARSANISGGRIEWRWIGTVL